jgi:hypothetical protein
MLVGTGLTSQKMPRVVINKCYGGFRLSDAGLALYKQYAQTDDCWVCFDDDSQRASVHLVRVVEELGAAAAGSSSSELKIVDVPDDVEWTIEEYDGIEWVAEVHRTWS